MFRDARYIRSEHELKVPLHLNFGKFILDRIRVIKDRIALINGRTGEKMTYSELAQYAVNLASALLKLGVGVGDVVALCSENRIEFIAIIIGIILTGATCTPISNTVGRDDLSQKIQLVKPKYIITSKQFWDLYSDKIKHFNCVTSIMMIEDIYVEMVTPIKTLMTDVNVQYFEPVKVNGLADKAIIFYTSGSSGKPKGIFVSHLTYIANCSITSNFENPQHKVMISGGDCSNGYDNEMTFIFLTLGRTVVHYDESCLFFQCVQDYKVDTAVIYPFLIYDMTEKEEAANFNLNSIEYVYCATAHLDTNLRDKYMKKYPNVKTLIDGYGMSETFIITSEHWGIPGLKRNTIGKVAPRITVKVVDLNTRELLGPNQLGELCVEARNVFDGYIGIEPFTYLDEEGFLSTGDLVYYDEDQYFYIVDRIKEIIKFEGYKVSPVQIENFLLRHPGVKDAGVVGKPVPEHGEVPTAFIVKKPGVDVTEKELTDYISCEGANIMQLRGGVIFVDNIPRTCNGKIKRQDLRTMLNAS